MIPDTIEVNGVRMRKDYYEALDRCKEMCNSVRNPNGQGHLDEYQRIIGDCFYAVVHDKETEETIRLCREALASCHKIDIGHPLGVKNKSYDSEKVKAAWERVK